ncbi:MAG: DUF952 domain-containing protein [Nocardioides sp.]
MRIYHIASQAEWELAKAHGEYTTSTRGRSLAEEGFLHASYRDQVPVVFRSFYKDAREPLVLLTIDTERLEVPWREDEVGQERYPHIYGPLSPRAVVHVEALNAHGGTQSFTTLFLGEMFFRIVMALVTMLLAAAGSKLGERLDADYGPLLGAVLGLGLGVALWRYAAKRRG